MFGWENQAAVVARVYDDFTKEEQTKCIIFTGNYGEAGALNYYGSAYDLPEVICANGSYYLWGPGRSSGKIIIFIGISKDLIEDFCEDVQLAETIIHPYARENNIPVFIGRNPKISLQEVWPQLAGYQF